MAREPQPSGAALRTERNARSAFDGVADVPSHKGFVLQVVAGPDQGTELPVTDRRLLVGTSPVCDLRLTDEQVSRRHLAVVAVEGRVRIEDLDSTNGTVVIGVRITGAQLFGGEILEIGRSLISVHAQSDAPASKPTKPVVSFGSVLGVSRPMQHVYQLARRVAGSDVACVIEGATGTGKEQLAEAIHEVSTRAANPFVIFDCTAVPPTLMESALFGHEKGAFTGAGSMRKGVFEQASNGTLFIDEIGDLELSLQSKLLRVLQRKEVQRVGGNGWIRTDARILAATRRDLDREVQEGRFRDDLFFRLAVTRIELPPLVDRGSDVELLARHFWETLGEGAGPFPLEFLSRFRNYSWPGNVRELLNTVVRWHALGELAHAEPLGQPSPESSASGALPDVITQLIRTGVPFSKARVLAIEEFERRYVQSVLDKHGGNVTRAAQASGIGRRHFHMLLTKAGGRA